jgi:glutathione S-transferase
MFTVWGEGRGFRVVWLLEEMGLPYRLRPVDLLAGAENDPEFLAINPAGFIPALQDGDTILVESIAIMEYLIARYGPSPLAPAPENASFARYKQFLHLGEAGLMVWLNLAFMSRNIAPEAERNDWSGREALDIFRRRMRLVTDQLEAAPFMAGDAFTAADISVAYALRFAVRTGTAELGTREHEYLARTEAREGYRRAMVACRGTQAWAQSAGG